ncbi:isochorismate synthase [Psychromonas algarum]|uniref:isochorismate synthase n=1 Tax=Psychromonas algarum TaxID=2555643 RepID=UPI001FB94D35|nr:isochorismate synthase [Psychromonas sp. RZ22]
MHQFQQLQKILVQQLQSFSLDHGLFPTKNLTVTIDSLPLLPLLKGQTTAQPKNCCLLPTIYWQNKEQTTTLASFGAIETLEHIPKADNNALYLGGLAFQQQGEQWSDFPATLFIRPLLVFQHIQSSSLFNQTDNTSEQWQAVFHFNGTNSVEKSIHIIQALQPPQALSAFTQQQIKRHDSPNQTQWASLVELAIEYKALLPKVVLSRETELTFDGLLNTWDIMALWQQANPNSFHYVFQLSQEHSFISCSPERLYSRRQQQLTTEALAGTVNRGRDKREDNLLLQSLLNDKKIDRENYLVQEFIIANLKQLKAEVSFSPAHVLQLQHVQHLCVPITAQLTQQTKDSDLLYKLHPTPAVGGTPKLPALQFINDNEPYNRGWYAGAVGCISEQESDFSVAIRSALVSKNNIKLFAGAGIVTGSIAEQEWQELDNKIQTILTILGAR